MTDLAVIKEAVTGVVEAAFTAFPRVTWANQITDHALPYLVLQVVPLLTEDRTLAQTSPVWKGFISATAVTDIDTLETDGDAMTADLAALFPAATRITMTDGNTLLISDHPQFRDPVMDGATRWRTAVRINIETA